ncbi:hypothetical protein NIES2101_13130 [Calothrix sp. HK-06]|nr:hypothetical protein NIES2101_13130 [Calothrix sp. HK-06]
MEREVVNAPITGKFLLLRTKYGQLNQTKLKVGDEVRDEVGTENPYSTGLTRDVPHLPHLFSKK